MNIDDRCEVMSDTKEIPVNKTDVPIDLRLVSFICSDVHQKSDYSGFGPETAAKSLITQSVIS